MTLLEIGSEGRLRSEGCHKRALARSAEWTESLPRGARIAEARVGVVQRGPYVVRVAGKTTQRGHVLPCVDGGGVCRLAPEYCREAEGVCRRVRRVSPAMAPEYCREAEGVCRRVPCLIRKRACVALCACVCTIGSCSIGSSGGARSCKKRRLHPSQQNLFCCRRRGVECGGPEQLNSVN